MVVVWPPYVAINRMAATGSPAKTGSDAVVVPATIVTVAVMKLAPVGNVTLAAAVDDDTVPLKGLDVTLTGFPPDSGTTLTVAVVPGEIPEATSSMVVVPDWGGSVRSEERRVGKECRL